MKQAKETHSFTSLLRQNKLKATPARLAILELFSAGHEPLRAEEIFKAIARKKTNAGGVDMVTVYRTIASFEAAGILKKVDLHAGSAHYELSGHHHHHLVCISCGAIEDVEECIGTLEQKVLSQSKRFSAIDHHSLEFFGTCHACNS